MYTDPTGLSPYNPPPSQQCYPPLSSPYHPSGLAVTEVVHIFKYDTERGIRLVVFKLFAKISDGNLTITVMEDRAFELQVRQRRFTFHATVAGAPEGDNERGKDTDSLQVAVRWSTATKKDVGHDTNAMPADGPRDVGANWPTFGGTAKGRDEWRSWKTGVPREATWR